MAQQRRHWCGLMFQTGLLVLLVASPSRGQSDITLDDALNNKGLHPERSYFSPEPFEQFDTLSGNVVLTFTDLVLPGNAGRQLRFQRSYNNQHYQSGGFATGYVANSRWQFGFPGMVMRVFERQIPPNPNFNTLGSILQTTPSFIMADGSWRRSTYTGDPTAGNPANMEVVSEGFYKYDRLNHVLKMPDGTVCEYDLNTGRLKKFYDPFNNVVELEWGATEVVVTQHLGNNQSRQVVLTLDEQGSVQGMTYDGREWVYEYGYEFGNMKDITRVVLPGGSEWVFAYDDHTRDAAILYEWNGLVSITTPNKGVVRYDYAELNVCESPPGTGCELRRHLTARHSEGPRGTVSGTWQIILYSGGATFGQYFSGETTVITPSETRVEYRHTGTITGSPENALAGGLGIGFRKIYPAASTQPLETESTFYTDLRVTPSAFVPGIQKREVLRNGRTFKTEYTYDQNNFGDYHNPRLVVETGHIVRVTEYTYLHLSTPWITGLVLSQEVQLGPETLKRRWTYNALGFKTSEIGWYRPSQASSGVVTNYSPDGFGNVATKTIAGRPSTSFTYEWGRLRLTQTPLYTVSRTINPDGTIESETTAGRTTMFDYDDLMRQTQITPPGGESPIITEYDDQDGAFVKKKRGSWFVTTTLDGFGRVVGTLDSGGVQTTTEYDAEGRVRFQSYPFDALHPEVRTEIRYDALDRVTNRINPGGSSSAYVRRRDDHNDR